MKIAWAPLFRSRNRASGKGGERVAKKTSRGRPRTECLTKSFLTLANAERTAFDRSRTSADVVPHR
jgi:hypothetical protein